MRKLASIRIIEEVAPIEGADRIEKVRVGGWWVVSQKGNFKQGDSAVYFEIDSFLPLKEQFSFLEKGGSRRKSIVDNKEVEGYRLKTVKLRGQLSQGLALPLSLFPGIQTEVGTDVSDLIGVLKYEPPVPACISGEVVGAFPGFIPKSDEERVQNFDITIYQNKTFYVSSKLDGTSMTIYKFQNDFGVCGRNWNMKETENNTLWKVANKYDLRNKLPEGFAIQAELVGEGINRNRLKLSGHDLYVFYVFDIKNAKYLSLEEMKKFCFNLNLKIVPIVFDEFILNHSIESLLKLSETQSPLNKNVLQEGLVFRLKEEGYKVSFKCISNIYLLKYES